MNKEVKMRNVAICPEGLKKAQDVVRERLFVGLLDLQDCIWQKTNILEKAERIRIGACSRLDSPRADGLDLEGDNVSKGIQHSFCCLTLGEEVWSVDPSRI